MRSTLSILPLALVLSSLAAGCNSDEGLPGPGTSTDLRGDSVPDGAVTDGIVIPGLDGPGMTDYSPCPEAAPVPTLAALRAKAIGSWSGPTTTPWTNPYVTELVLTGDGHYSAHANGPAPALYYGLDDDSPVKTWLIDDIHANGDGFGQLEVYFGPGPTNRGSIEHLRTCTKNGVPRLDFEFWATWDGRRGPVVFRLAKR